MDNILSFQDKIGRDIQIGEEHNGVVAKHNNEKIGYIEVEWNDNGNPYLYYMSTEENYRRAGIGMKMMELVADLYGQDIGKPSFNAVGGSTATCCSEYFTEDGAALVRCCIGKGILKK